MQSELTLQQLGLERFIILVPFFAVANFSQFCAPTVCLSSNTRGLFINVLK